MIETLKFALGAIVVVVVLWLALTRLARFLSWVERSEIARQKAEAAEQAAQKKGLGAPVAAAAGAAFEPEGVPADHVVAIAAAVAACGFRVVHIDDVAVGHAWAAEGRLLHQTSHRRF
jgi:Na+-transporting methylmalonyl-CoA/oxaloacetate decarboxylase gamma subunit